MDEPEIESTWPDMVGFKYKISNIQAAIRCAQMERIDELVSVSVHFISLSLVSN